MWILSNKGSHVGQFGLTLRRDKHLLAVFQSIIVYKSDDAQVTVIFSVALILSNSAWLMSHDLGMINCYIWTYIKKSRIRPTDSIIVNLFKTWMEIPSIIPWGWLFHIWRVPSVIKVSQHAIGMFTRKKFFTLSK